MICHIFPAYMQTFSRAAQNERQCSSLWRSRPSVKMLSAAVSTRVTQTEDSRQFLVVICMRKQGQTTMLCLSPFDEQLCRGSASWHHHSAQSEESDVTLKGLETLKSLLSEDAISGRGMRGPQVEFCLSYAPTNKKRKNMNKCTS